jgi:cell fate (sporulation/competence/biofilm development) regulator YlbF (YheA/YmcA/DUF963 family)
MKLYSMFLSVVLLATACAAQAMEEATASVDLKAQLQAHIIACDADQFNATWQTYQTVAQAQEVAATQSTLTKLTTQLRAHKDQDRMAKLNDKWSRCIAAISAGATASASGGLFIAFLNTLRKLKIPVAYQFYKGKYSKAILETLVIAGCLAAGYLVVKEFTYARFAGTQQLSKEIAALDEIVACLNPQSPESIETETETIN